VSLGVNRATIYRALRLVLLLVGPQVRSERRHIAVGMPITGHPPHRTGRAAFPHPAPTLDV
jgi:hypothetical protein